MFFGIIPDVEIPQAKHIKKKRKKKKKTPHFVNGMYNMKIVVHSTQNLC